MIMCVSVQVSARERERECAGIQGECGSARNVNARVSRYRYFAFTSALLTPHTHIHMNLCSAVKAGGERKGKAAGSGSAFGIGIAAISHHSHTESGGECNRWNARGMRSNGKDGMQGNRKLANAGISRLYSLALYLTSMHTHMHNECMWIWKGMQAGVRAVQVGENLRENSREILSKFSQGRKPNAELNLNLGPRLGPSVHLRTFRFSRFVPSPCDPSEPRALLVLRVRSAVPSPSATAGV